MLLLLETAAILPVCHLVSFDNLITTSSNRCILSLLMVRLGRINDSIEVKKGFFYKGGCFTVGRSLDSSADRLPDGLTQRIWSALGDFYSFSLESRS